MRSPDEALLWRAYEPAVSQPAAVQRLKPDFSTGDRAADAAQNEEDDADDHQDPTEGDEDGYRQYVTEDEQDNSEGDHDYSIQMLGFAG
jgi:hypothetical protein